MARPEKWDDRFLRVADGAAKLGATDIEIADMLGISVRTLHYWKHEHPELVEVLKSGKEVADERVERSLYARANGYEHDEVDIRVIRDEIIQTPIRKYYPPDTTAAIFWLKNRRAAQWREVKAVELSGPDGSPVKIVATAHDETL